jgi:rhodanese-related sulfurtransferase
MDFLKKLFGMKTREDYKKMIEQGGTIIDVRTPAEFKMGHPNGAKNIPLQNLESKISEKKNETTYLSMLCIWNEKCFGKSYS